MEDDPSDVYLICTAIETSGLKGSITVQKNGELATKFLDEVDSDATLDPPDLVILDLNLPRLAGAGVLAHIKRSRRCQNAVVVVVSTSSLDADRERVMELGANAYFRKPSQFDEFLKLGGVILSLLQKTSNP